MASEPKIAIGVPVYVAAAFALLGAALFLYLRMAGGKVPEATLTPEGKEYVKSLSLSSVTMQARENYFEQVIVEINGKIGNQGDRGVEVVELYCVFYDRYGQLVLRKRIPIVSQRMGGLKPGEVKSFRLPFDEIPESWNNAMPQLVIAAVRFT